MASEVLQAEHAAVRISTFGRARRRGRLFYPLMLIATASLALMSFVPWMGLVAILTGAAAAIASAFYLREQPEKEPDAWPAHVELQGSGLRLRGEEHALQLSPDDIVAGWPQGRRRVVLRLRDRRTVTIDANATATARLLATLMVRSEQGAARVWIGSQAAAQHRRGAVLVGFYAPLPFAWVGAIVTGVMIKVVLHGYGAHGIAVVVGAFSLALLLVSFACARRLTTRELLIGTDGIAIGRRFVPYESIKSVFQRLEAVHVVQHKNPSLVLPSPQAAAVAQRIGEALCRATRSMDAGLERLARQGRSVDAWRRELAGLAEPETGYRDAAFGLDRLIEVVADARVSPDRRVGAALAIASSSDDKARRRVRLAARSSANARLRKVLERAADGEVLDAELEQIEADHASGGREANQRHGS